MPKLDVNVRLFTVIGLMLYVGIFAACKDPVVDDTNPENPTENAWVEFRNLEQFPVTIYSDSGRNIAIAEVAALDSAIVAAEPASAGNAFYPTFRLDIFDIPGISIPYNGEPIVSLIEANKTTSVPIPKLESIVINSAFIKIVNDSSYSLALRQGSGEKSPLGGGSTVINSGQIAVYELFPGPVSNYSIFSNTTTPVAFPVELIEFKRGIIYVLTFNGTDIELDEEKSVLQTIPPAVPENVQAEVISNDSVRITWKDVSGATSYKVYRANGSANALYSQITNTAMLSWIDTGLSAGQIHYYKVSAVSGINMASEQSEEVLVIMPVGNLQVSVLTDNSVSFTWNAVSGTNGYNVYRSDSENGHYSKINTDTIISSEFTDTGLTAFTAYYYKISAILGEVEGALSNAILSTTLFSAPLNVKVSITVDNSISLSWNAVSGANGYNVYRSDNETGVYTKINNSSVNGTTFIDTGINPYTAVYYYKVSAVSGNIGGIQSNHVASVIMVSGNGLIEKLSWLQNNAANNTLYSIKLDTDEYIAPQTLSYSGKNGVAIFLSGNGMRTVNLSSYGRLFTVSSGVTLILDNNITLKGMANNNNNLVYINNGGTLVINTGAKIIENSSSSYGGGVYVSGTFTMNGGEISGNISSYNGNFGGGVSVGNNGAFIMNGGIISGNSSSAYGGGGGGVSVGSNGIFIMNGGEISGNSTATRGGGVCVYRGTFIMNNGEISGNTSSYDGGGVYIVDSGFFIMDGGEISGNNTTETDPSSPQVGGGIYLNDGSLSMNNGEISGNSASLGGGIFVRNGTFTMSGGKISGNTSTATSTSFRYGGGISVSGGTFSMSGGEISGNSAYSGGGISVTGGTFTMSGGEILGNSVSSDGGGVSIFGTGTFTMSGGKISGNSASSNGGGVYVSNSRIFTMSGGEISGNSSASSGGGVFVYINCEFIMSGGVIYGNNSAAGLQNTAINGASLYLYKYGSYITKAEYGILNGDTFIKSGDLGTTDTTIRVVNGNLLTE